VNAALNAAKAGFTLAAIGLALSVAVAATPVNPMPELTLVGTDTNEPFPFAAIVFNHETYHVTEGDKLDGVYIRHISPDRVTLSDDRVLVSGVR
jgi:hypothetical protein